MIVSRAFHYPKPGHWDDVVEYLKADAERVSANPHLHACRVYSREEGTGAPVSTELEFESGEERKKFWAGMRADPERPARQEKYWKLVDSIWTSELWNVID